MKTKGGRFAKYPGGFFGSSNSGSRTSTGSRRSNVSRVWYLDDAGKLKMGMLVTGMTDGKFTEVVRSRAIKEGMKVITGIQTDNSSRNSGSNVLGPGGMPRGMRRAF